MSNTPSLADGLFRFLSRANSYPDPTASISVAETHISMVFLTDRYVYKFKKPVRFPFLDYSTLERRLAACREEVRLNSRLAPGVYLDVLAVRRDASGRYDWGDGSDVVDYGVKMERLPADCMLDALIHSGAASATHIGRLLDLLVPFYARAGRGREIDEYARAAALEQPVRENLAFFRSQAERLDEPMLGRVAAAQLQFIKLDAPLFAERITAGRICEGHGDLRPEHVCLMPDRTVVFDCVEFSQAFRSADVLSELAFLAMECDFLGAPELSHALLDGYRARSGDHAPESLASFYKSYRACVRAKVEILRGGQECGSAAELHVARARRYLQLASYYASDFYRPMLLVTVGAAGTGKSTVARAVAESLGLELLASDSIRHELAGHREPDADYGQGIYSDAMTRRTYDTMFERAERFLTQARSVVLDGTFRAAEERGRAEALAGKLGADLHFLYCHCPPELAQERIAARRARQASRHHAANAAADLPQSDARPDMHAAQQREIESSADWNSLARIELDTSNPPQKLAEQVIEWLSSI